MIATTLLERKAIEIGVKEGKTYLTLSETLNLSIGVVRKWGQKVKKKSLKSVMGRPKTGLLSSFSSQVVEQIEIYRPDISGWSGQTIAVELSLESKLASENLPSVSSINKYLSKRGKNRRLITT